MMGIPKALKVLNKVGVALGEIGGSESTSGHRDNIHSRAPQSSCHPVSMISLVGSKTATFSLVKRTLISVSQKGPILIAYRIVSGTRVLYD